MLRLVLLAIVDLWNVGLLAVVLALDVDLDLFGFDFGLFDVDLNCRIEV